MRCSRSRQGRGRGRPRCQGRDASRLYLGCDAGHGSGNRSSCPSADMASTRGDSFTRSVQHGGRRVGIVPSSPFAGHATMRHHRPQQERRRHAVQRWDARSTRGRGCPRRAARRLGGDGPGRLPDAIPHATAGFVAIGCGLVAGIRVRWSRIGLLLWLLGLTWFVGDFSTCLNIEPLAHRCLQPGLFGDAAGALAWAWLGVFGHIAASFPDGRIRSRWRRAAVAALYLAVIAVSIAGLVPPPAQLLGARTALAVAVSLGALAVLAALLAVDARRAGLTPDRAVGLGPALATALGDPRFRIAFENRAGGGCGDAAGRPPRAPSQRPSWS